MRITNNNLSFGKKLEARCCILKNKKPYKCRIYSLEEKDKNYFTRKGLNKYFKLAFTDEFCKAIGSDYKEINIIEDQKGKFLGGAITHQGLYNLTVLDIIETLSKNNTGYIDETLSKNNTEYIGETLLSFLVQKAKKDDKNGIYVRTMTRGGIEFYIKSHFTLLEKPSSRLDSSQFDKLIAQNLSHVGKKINFVK